MTHRNSAKLFILTVLFGTTLGAQAHQNCPPLIGEKAPIFKAKTTQGEVDFPADYKDKWVILFSHPADFTPVCTTEYRKLAKMVPQFADMNTMLLGLSTDPKEVHEKWVKSLEEKHGEKMRFPIISDPEGKIATRYGMIHPAADKEKTQRSVFFVDPEGKIRAILHYPQETGRSFKELLRLLAAMQLSDEKDVITPADWQPGQEPLQRPAK